MATVRPFAYNIGSPIPDTEQLGNLAIGQAGRDYSQNYGGVRWFMGPDEDLGYVISHQTPSNDQPTQPGIDPPFGNVGFWRTVGFLDSDFINLSQFVARINGDPQTFATANDAKTWLNTNGYWTSFGLAPVSPTPTPTNTPTPSITTTPSSTFSVTPTPTETPSLTSTPDVTPTPTTTPTPTSGDETLINPIITENDEYIEVGNDYYLMFVDPIGPIPSPTVTPTQTSTPTITPTQSLTPTVTITPTSSEVPSPSPSNTPTLTPTTTVTQTPSSTPTNTPTPSITVSSTPTNTSTPTPTPTSGATPTGFLVTVQQVGPDVVWSGSGSLNLTNLTLDNTTNIGAGFAADQAVWAAGPISQVPAELWGGASFNVYPTSFGTPGGAAPSSSTGSIFGVLFGGSGRTLIVPPSYVSGSLLNGSTTYNSTTIAAMGLISGTYVWSWGTGPNADSMTMIIG